MDAGTSVIDRFAAVLGTSRRGIEDVVARLRADPALVRASGPGRRAAGTSAFSASEIVNIVLAIAAGPPAGRRGLNACDTVRAARDAVRFHEWEDGQPQITADFFEGTTFDPDVATLGDALDAIVADMAAETWPESMTARLRFDCGGGKILLVIKKWPPGARTAPAGDGPARTVDVAMVFHGQALLDAWIVSCLETSVFVNEFALPKLASAARPK